MHRMCITLRAPKGEVFAELKNNVICFPLYRELERHFPTPDPGPLDHLGSLATIIELAASLPARLPMRNELRSLATRALEVAVADFGPDIQLHQVDTKTDVAQTV